jgi:hypothetical protein
MPLSQSSSFPHPEASAVTSSKSKPKDDRVFVFCDGRFREPLAELLLELLAAILVLQLAGVDEKVSNGLDDEEELASVKEEIGKEREGFGSVFLKVGTIPSCFNKEIKFTISRNAHIVCDTIQYS